jgi:hypothetical protein
MPANTSNKAMTSIISNYSARNIGFTISEVLTTHKRYSGMKTKRGLILLSVCAVVAFNVIRAEASDPVGIYAIVEKVVFEPNDQAPERIQVWGAFALSDAQHGDGYLAPQRGYLYYSLPIWVLSNMEK